MAAAAAVGKRRPLVVLLRRRGIASRARIEFGGGGAVVDIVVGDFVVGVVFA